MLSKLSEAEEKNNQDIYLLNKEKINLNPKFPMINFFDLDPKSFQILNPYDFEQSLKTINSMTSEHYHKNYFNDYFKKDYEFRGYEEDINFSIDNISFLTSTIIENNSKDNLENKDINNNNLNNEYISLVNLVKDNYIVRQDNKSVNIKSINKEKSTKENNNSINENKDSNNNINIYIFGEN